VKQHAFSNRCFSKLYHETNQSGHAGREDSTITVRHRFATRRALRVGSPKAARYPASACLPAAAALALLNLEMDRRFRANAHRPGRRHRTLYPVAAACSGSRSAPAYSCLGHPNTFPSCHQSTSLTDRSDPVGSKSNADRCTAPPGCYPVPTWAYADVAKNR
jgi:hypothetical protein